MDLKYKHNIHSRIYNFVIKVLLLIKKLPKSAENAVVIYQITKSVTSMGANDREADGTITCSDFIHKYSIVRKEGKETEYWLSIIRDTHQQLKTEIDELITECIEIIKIVTKIIYNTQQTKNNKYIHK
jgi:four helix bundle protein